MSKITSTLKTIDTDEFTSILAKRFYLEFKAKENREKRRDDVLLAMLKSGTKGRDIILNNSKK
ncbi:MAG: hypothetical protein MUF58_10535 [Arcicella sp.]|jgi:hypothetical protein|nr:hypothetical protein [Arcicella sp.]